MDGKRNSFLVIILIALVMTASLAGGYKAITLLSPEVKEQFDVYTDPVMEALDKAGAEKTTEEAAKEVAEEAPFVYSGTGSDYSGPVIYESEGNLSNSDGKVRNDFANKNGEDLEINTNKYASEAVFICDGKGYYVDADLNVIEFADHVAFAGMCFDGGYFFYATEDAHQEKKLYLFDTGNKTKELMAQGSIRSIGISPDGRTLVYSMIMWGDQIHVVSLDQREEKVFEAEEYCTPVSVSNDGETVFYYIAKTGYIYCLDHGKSTRFDEQSYKNCYLDRECKQLLYFDKEGGVKYYRAGEDKPFTLIDDRDAEIRVNAGSAVSLGCYKKGHIIDADYFSDAVMISSWKKGYALYGYTPKLVDMTEGADNTYFIDTYVTKGGPQCIYKYENDLYRAVYDGESVTTTVLYKGVHYPISYECIPDLSKIWVHDGTDTFYIEQGAEPIRVEESEEDEFAYRDQNTRSYTGPKISQAGQYIYNTDGKIIDDFHSGDKFYLDLTVNADRSEAVLVHDKVCYYIDADLNVTEIAKGVRDAGMCYDGGYFYYVLEDENYNTELYIYDVANQESNLIESEAAKYISISPNGRTLAFFDYAYTKKFCVAGLDIERCEIETDERPNPVAVSNDGEVAFYIQYTSDGRSSFRCIDHGTDKIVSRGVRTEYYFDRECKQIMFIDAWGLKYFREGYDEAKILTKEKQGLRFDHCRGSKMPISYFSDSYILDTDCFSDVLMLHNDDECYGLAGMEPKLVCLTLNDEKARNFSMTITDQGPVCLAMSRGKTENFIKKFSFDGKKLAESIVFGGDSLLFHGYYGCNNDLDKIWIVYDNDIYYLPQDSDPVLLASEGREMVTDFKWNPMTERCYFKKNGEYLVSLGTDPDSEEKVSDNCKWLSFTPNDGEVIVFSGFDDKKYLLIGDEILPE